MTQNERIFLPWWKRVVIVIATVIVFALQIMLFVFAFQVNFDFPFNVWIYWIIEGGSFVLVYHIIHRPILTNYKLTWSILILIFTLPFSLLYYLNQRSLALPKYKQKKIDTILGKYYNLNQIDCTLELDRKDPKAAKLARILRSSTGYPLWKNTKYTFLFDGLLKHEDMLVELKKATRYIFIECFIISDGKLLSELLPILKEKGDAGVEIKIIYDDLGSKATLKKKTILEIAQIKNCTFTNYNPLGLNINPAFNYRDHRKMVIIDGKTAYCGGDNLADEYIHQKKRFGFWRDNCGKYEGEAVQSFIALFIEMWYISTKMVLKLENYLCDYALERENSYILPFGDGPSNGAEPGYDIFRSLISSADQTLYISTPYLIIDEAMIESIVLAAKSGVDVRILMPGIPDKKVAWYLGRFHYKEILLAGGKIYEYTPGFNHAKNIIVDGRYAFIGTINMDYRSLFLHYECGALILLDNEIYKMKDDFLKACDDSKPITYEDWKKRPWWQKLISYLLYLFAPLF